MVYSRTRAISLKAATIGEVLATAGFVLVLNKLTAAQRQKGAWRKYLVAANGILATVRAATELVASGNERAHLGRLRKSIDEWAWMTSLPRARS